MLVVAQGISTLAGGGGAAVKLWHVAFPSSPAVSGSITVEPVLTNRPFSTFVAWARGRPEIQHPPQAATSADQAKIGDIHPVRLSVNGLSGKEATLRWVMFDKNTTQRIPIAKIWPASLVLRPPNNSWSPDEELWVPIPLNSNDYILRLTLTTPGQTDPIGGPAFTDDVKVGSG